MNEICIHSNINSYMSNYPVIMAEYKMHKKLWEDSHYNMKYHGKINYDNYDEYDPRDIDNNECEIYFYEWSNIYNSPLKFSYYTDFYEFLDKCNIKLKYYENDEIKRNNISYIVCKEGCNELIIKKDYTDFKK